MYGRLFASTYTGSMVGAGLNVFAVWGYVIANTRQSGHVELNPPVIAATLGCTVGEVTAAIEVLCSPDPNSRSPKEQGRRLIQEAAFLYFVPTYSDYRAMRSDDDRVEYMRNYMRNYRAKKDAAPAERTKRINKPKPVKSAAPQCPHEKIIALYHEHLPMLPKIRVWPDVARKHLTSRWAEDEVRHNLEWWEKFFKYVGGCPHLIGATTSWKATLVWLVNPTNMAKVINGNYDPEDK